MSSSRPGEGTPDGSEPAELLDAAGRSPAEGGTDQVRAVRRTAEPQAADSTAAAPAAERAVAGPAAAVQGDEGGVRQPVQVSMRRVVASGMGLWALALVATLVAPPLRTGDRSWWPWCCVAGLALGALGLAYLSLGRGNAADA